MQYTAIYTLLDFGVLRAYGLALLSKRTREIAFLEIENWKEMQNTPEGDGTCMINYSEGRYRTLGNSHTSH